MKFDNPAILTLAVSVPEALSVPMMKLELVVVVMFKVLPTPLIVRLAFKAEAAAALKLITPTPVAPVTFKVLPAPMLSTLAVAVLSVLTTIEPSVLVAPKVTALLPEPSEPNTKLLAVLPVMPKLNASALPLAELSVKAPVNVSAVTGAPAEMV